MQSLQAHLLIATPDLVEPFARSVVLLVRHNEEGALGLILNRRTNLSLKEAWARLSEVPCHRDEALYLGGPCEGPLVALHTHEFLLELEVMPGLYFCAGKDNLQRLAAQTGSEPSKFFAGYAGWSAGQLEAEIARGSWSVLPARFEHVFQQDDELWVRTTRQVSDAALRSALKIKQAPPDASLN
ncbi:MAG: YqgE/AlgH family protein [Planctomycetia bacterium]|nr:YqgE/AlgH family protein [Planctomycetia bacterium]